MHTRACRGEGCQCEFFSEARVSAELVRPDVSGPKWGGYDLEQMRVAFLARAIQTRLPYIHHCTTKS